MVCSRFHNLVMFLISWIMKSLDKFLQMQFNNNRCSLNTAGSIPVLLLFLSFHLNFPLYSMSLIKVSFKYFFPFTISVSMMKPHVTLFSFFSILKYNFVDCISFSVIDYGNFLIYNFVEFVLCMVLFNH